MPMQAKDKLDLSNKNFLDMLVDYRRFLVSVIVIISAVLALYVPTMQTDPSLKSGLDSTSPTYLENLRFTEIFGNEEFVLVVIRNDRGAGDPQVLSGLERITSQLEKHDKVSEVVSLSNLMVFQKKDQFYGNYPLIRTINGEAHLPDHADLDRIRKALPVTDFLLSPDLKSVGVLVRMHERWKFDPSVIEPFLKDLEEMVKENSPSGTDYRIIGAALIRRAIVRYSIQTGFVFGILCMLIATIVSIYIFKSARITAITNVILLVCILWVLGLMAISGIPLNSTTALAFGFIPITTLEMVIHMVIRYRQFYQNVHSRVGAVKQAVRWLARPFFMCSATTAVGFGSLMVSSIPMVRQLGFIMFLGIMISYCLAMILTPAFFIHMKSLDSPTFARRSPDWLDRVLGKIEKTIFSHYRLIVAIGIAISVFLFAGAPLIRSDAQISRFLSPSTQEVKDLNFVEENLTKVSSLELMLDADQNAFKKPEVWKKVMELEKRLSEIPEVASTDSLSPFLIYLYALLDPAAHSDTDVFSKPQTIPQVIVLTSLNPAGHRLIRRFVDENFQTLRITVRIKNSPTVPIRETIEQVRSTADSVLKNMAKATVTGDLTVFAGQTAALITDQVESMVLAAVIITVLMIIQMGSPLLGLISLIPNIPPVAAVFGIMGWFGVSLDGVTVFAATVAIGLAVDNTIHFLTQLKREIRFSQGQGMEKCVARAYRLTAKQMASWSTVTLLGFLALSVSPFRPVVLFGILGSSAILLGLFGDLMFIQSLILASSSIRNTITRLIDKETAAEK
jgi:hypothetical protein